MKDLQKVTEKCKPVSTDLLHRGHTSTARYWKCLLEASTLYVSNSCEGPSCWHPWFHVFFMYFWGEWELCFRAISA